MTTAERKHRLYAEAKILLIGAAHRIGQAGDLTPSTHELHEKTLLGILDWTDAVDDLGAVVDEVPA